MTRLQRIVQYAILYGTLINSANLYINLNRYSRDYQTPEPTPVIEIRRPSRNSNR